MAVHHAVLGLLAGGPSHGYELKANFEKAVGPQWGELNIGHLYQVLDRLTRDTFVSRRAVSQADRPDKFVYRLTKSGRAELDRWLESPLVRQGGYRDDLFLKIFVASRLGSVRLRRALHVQRKAYLSELAGLGDLRLQHRDDPVVDLLIQAAILHTEANLKVVEAAEQDIEHIARGSAHDRAEDTRSEAQLGA